MLPDVTTFATRQMQNVHPAKVVYFKPHSSCEDRLHNLLPQGSSPRFVAVAFSRKENQCCSFWRLDEMER